MRLSLVILVLLISPLLHATVYKWVDKDGKVHFSDEPSNNAEVVEFKKNTENQVKLPQPYRHTDKAQVSEEKVSYDMRISSPNEEETIRSNEGKISLALQIEPELAVNHFLVLFMDGKQQGDAQQSARFQLNNIDRGEHSFIVKALTQDGRLLASTPPRKVFLHRTIQNSAR